MLTRKPVFFMAPEGGPGGGDPAPAPAPAPIPPVPAPAPAPAPAPPPAPAPARRPEPDPPAPWKTLIPKDLRGDDMNTWGATWADMIGNVRTAFKENAEMRTKMETLTKGVPEKAEDYAFNITDAVKPFFSPEDLKSFQALAKEFNLPAAAAQKLVDFESQRALAARKGYKEYVDGLKAKSRETLRAKYKDKTEATIAAAIATVEAIGGKELRDEFENSPFGNHPLIIEAFAQVSQHYTERSPNLPPAPGGGQGGITEVDLAHVYSKSAKQMGLRS